MSPPEKSRPAPCGHEISAVSITHHRLPLAPPLNASWDTRPRAHFDATVVRVSTARGLVGVASGDRMLGFEGHEDLFVGRDPLALERHYRVLSNIDFHYGRCWPLDLALWDLAGKILGQPCWKLLGGLASRVRAYASSATLRDAKAQADAAERYLAEGFPALKLRFRLQPGVAAALGHAIAVGLQGRTNGRARARAPPGLLDGRAVASRRLRRHAGAARGDRRAHRGWRDDAPGARAA